MVMPSQESLKDLAENICENLEAEVVDFVMSHFVTFTNTYLAFCRLATKRQFAV